MRLWAGVELGAVVETVVALAGSALPVDGEKMDASERAAVNTGAINALLGNIFASFMTKASKNFRCFQTTYIRRNLFKIKKTSPRGFRNFIRLIS